MVDERIHYLARHHGTSASAVVNAIIGEIDYAHVFALFSASPPLTLSAIVIETHMSPTMVRELHREFLDGLAPLSPLTSAVNGSEQQP
jgi:hypothetical protein